MTFFGCPFGKCSGTNAYENGRGTKSQHKYPKGSRKENEEKAPGTCFPLKEENLRLPSSSEDCKFCIGSNTHCMPEGTVANISAGRQRFANLALDQTSNSRVV